MTIETLISDLKSYGTQAHAERESLADCLEGLWNKLQVNGDGMRDFRKQKKLKEYLSTLNRSL